MLTTKKLHLGGCEAKYKNFIERYSGSQMGVGLSKHNKPKFELYR